ncbi:MAG: mechanosensitive ion channel family protein [Bacteroidia bacterium]
MKKLIVLFILSVTVFSAFSQAEKVDLSTPRKTVYNHLWYLQKEQYKPAVSAESFANKKAKNQDLERVAIQLKQILDGKGIFIETEKIPNTPLYKDSITNKAIYVLDQSLPDVYLVKQGNQWVFSIVTIKAIPRIHKEVFPTWIAWIMDIMPKSWHTEILGLELAQYMGILIIIIMALLLHKVLSLLFRFIILGIFHRFNKSYAGSHLLKTVARPLSWFLIVQFVEGAVPALMLPINISRVVVMLLSAAAPLAGTILFYNLVALLADFFMKRAQKTEGTLDDQLVPLVSKMAKVLVVVIGIAYILFGFGLDVRAYLVGVSFGGIALALAAQDTVKNLFGSAMIFLDRPFQIGDWINYSGMDGTVEEVGFRTTRIRTFYNSIISIPNGKLADTHVDNFGLRVYRRYSTKLSITYDTPPELIDVFVEGLKEIVKNHPSTRKDYFEVHLNDLSDSSIQILFYIFFDAKDWSEELRARHQVLLAVIKLAKALGVRFAFPTQTLHVENMPGQQSLTPNNSKSRSDFEASMSEFITTWKSTDLPS